MLVKVGDIANAEAAGNGKPLDGIRVLALEQMQALPYATQLLARLGAEVVKVEPPTGESGRGSLPGMRDPYDRLVGATFLRNNLNKRSVAIDLKHPAGRDLVLRLAPRFDVVAENFKPGTAERFGLGYADVAAVHPTVVYVSVSGAGNLVESPYAEWPAYASMAEAVSGIYEYTRPEGQRPRANPVGALGDISSGAVRGDRAPRRAAAPRRARDRPARRHLDVRRHRGDDRHRDEPRVARRGAPARQQVARARHLPGHRRLLRRCSSCASTSSSASRNLVGHPEWLERPAPRDAQPVGRARRGHVPARDRALGRRADQARGGARVERRGHRRQPVPVVGRGARRPPPRRPQHDRGDGAHRRRRAAGAHPRQPGEALRHRRGPRDAHPLGRRAHPRGARTPSSASTTTSSPAW